MHISYTEKKDSSHNKKKGLVEWQPHRMTNDDWENLRGYTC
jgi:hypothetical protein